MAAEVAEVVGDNVDHVEEKAYSISSGDGPFRVSLHVPDGGVEGEQKIDLKRICVVSEVSLGQDYSGGRPYKQIMDLAADRFNQENVTVMLEDTLQADRSIDDFLGFLAQLVFDKTVNPDEFEFDGSKGSSKSKYIRSQSHRSDSLSWLRLVLEKNLGDNYGISNIVEIIEFIRLNTADFNGTRDAKKMKFKEWFKENHSVVASKIKLANRDMIRYELERVWELEGTEWIIRNAEANSHFKKIIRTKDIENTEQFNKYFRELQERYLCEKQAKLLGIGETRFYDAVQSTIKNKYVAFHKGITCPKYDPEGESASFSERYVIREAAGVLAKLALFNFNGLYYPMRVVDGEDLSCGDKKHLNNVIDLVLSEYEEQTKKPFNIFRAAIMHKNKVSHSERKVDKKQVSINGGVPVDVEFEQKTAGIGPLARLGSSKQLSGMIQRPTTPDTMILNRPTTPDTMMMSINKAMSELTFLQQQFVSMQMGIFQNKIDVRVSPSDMMYISRLLKMVNDGVQGHNPRKLTELLAGIGQFSHSAAPHDLAAVKPAAAPAVDEEASATAYLRSVMDLSRLS